MDEVDDLDFVTSEHDRLISAISKLDKTQHITEPTRNEPTNQNSEFNLIKTSNKLNINNVVKVLEDTAHHVNISKKLKKTHDEAKVLSKPLEKPQAERIKRSTGYEQTKKKVGRWDPVVARSRTVDYVSFPLKQAVNKLLPTEEFLSKFTLKSQLEKELDEVDPKPTVEESEDEEPMYPMSYEEMVEHRQHVAKMRAQESYKAAKAKRQGKIKSKKYHRILKKEKLKKQIKEFEDLKEKNPEEALKKLETLEKARALERHTLRHKNTGKWAKSKLVRAKYDKDVRQQLAEQLAVSRGLTHKTQDTESSDDEENNTEGIPDITLSQDPSNPWIMKRSDKSNIDAEFDFGYKKYLKNRTLKLNKDDSDEEININENSLGMLKEKIEQFNNQKMSIDNQLPVSENTTLQEIAVNSNRNSKKTKIPNRKTERKSIKSVTGKLVATSSWHVMPLNHKDEPKDVITAFDELENKVSDKVEIKLNKMKNELEKLEKISRKPDKVLKQKNIDKKFDSLEYLKLKQQKKAIIDEELIETARKDPGNNPEEDITLKQYKTTVQVNIDKDNTSNKTDSNIDPNRFIEARPKYLKSALPNEASELDDLDDEQVVPRVNIEEVFEEDDVVASFRQEKEDEVNKTKLEDIDLSLPGWGSWGGKGVKAPKRKKNRFILKAPPKIPRRDENKGDIIIKEYNDPKLSVHKIKDVPFPFTSVKEYEASIRAPLGNTFIPEKAHKKLIRPNIITKAGTIIEPMDEDELLIRKNRTFRNGSIIKLLGNK